MLDNSANYGLIGAYSCLETALDMEYFRISWWISPTRDEPDSCYSLKKFSVIFGIFFCTFLQRGQVLVTLGQDLTPLVPSSLSAQQEIQCSAVKATS